MMWDEITVSPWGRALVALGVFALWSSLWLGLAWFVLRRLKAKVLGTLLEEMETPLLRMLWLLRLWGVGAGAFLALEVGGGVVSPAATSALGKALFGSLVLILGGTATD